MSACPHCDAGEHLLYGEHIRNSERGVHRLGRCSAPDAVPEARRDDDYHAKVAAWRERVTGGGAVLAAEILERSRSTWMERSQPEEDDDA